MMLLRRTPLLVFPVNLGELMPGENKGAPTTRDKLCNLVVGAPLNNDLRNRFNQTGNTNDGGDGE
jgi:hypothetical protein